MTVAVRTRRPAARRRPTSSGIADRRRSALEHALRTRRGGERRRSRYVEDVSRDPKPLGFYVIAVVTLALVLFGLVMVLSSSSIVSFHRGGSPWRFFTKQLLWAAIGTGALFFTYRLPLAVLHKIAPLLPVFAGGFMMLSFAPGIGTTVNGARA